MPFDLNHARQHLQSFNLRKLFIEDTGWDRPGPDLDIPLNNDLLHLTGIAQKRGFMVYVCSPLATGQIPDHTARRKIETQVRKSIHEHIIIFSNLDNSRQVWQWVRHELGRPTTSREFDYSRGQTGEALLQRLQSLVFTLEEEEKLGVIIVSGRVKATFDVERVTRRFYDRFNDEHSTFMGFLQGIPDEGLQRWYVSVTLNRLMFVYFIQKKQFLDGDENYLRNHLSKSPSSEDRFYRDFLCPLFFEGFARQENERNPQMNRLLGKVPYLNGGIFQPHQIEQLHGKDIQICDAAFERIFSFFDQYRWYLDERPLRNDSEINPDVLGYIFEKYINQKEMGAYYTKEDITGYISKSTILPFLLNQARKDCAIAFEGDSSIWRMLAAEPQRYIYPAVQKGCDLTLPLEIEAGVQNVAQRGGWNKTAPEEFALPTETWREVVARRTRFEEIFLKLVDGGVHEVNDLITCNLDIQQFTQDVIETSEGPELLRAFWKGLRDIKILDPTCGSGAFLFAALNILEPLYEACLERMRIFVAELDQSGEKHRPEKFSDFRQTLAQIDLHPNLSYFILKSIIVNNLYGVDIMEEAVEICKLRLFLKLIAQVEQAETIEPLPDIDFNIRAGNTLVGFTSIGEVQHALTTDSNGQMFIPTPEITSQLLRIQEEAELADKAFKQFQRLQLEKGSITAQDKAELRQRLEKLNAELNRALAKTYDVDANSLDFAPWQQSHKPFHWLVDFYGIMAQGGFDVIIGNPPYVEYGQVKNVYTIKNYSTESSGNLYSYIIERNVSLSHAKTRSAMIVPHSAFCTDRMSPLMALFNSNWFWISTYDIRPSKLFDGVDQRLAVYILGTKQNPQNFSSRYYRWKEEYRSVLFLNLEYQKLDSIVFRNSLPKLCNHNETNIWKKLYNHRLLAESMIGSSKIYFHNTPRYWIRAMDFAPYFWNERDGEQISTQVKQLRFLNEPDALSAMAILNSSLFYWWFIILSDCRHLNMREIENFPVGLERMSPLIKKELATVSRSLMEDYKSHTYRKEAYYKTTGRVIYDEFYPRLSKPIIDEIDRVLAIHYGFTEEELDFILNYDIKYRLGADAEED